MFHRTAITSFFVASACLSHAAAFAPSPVTSFVSKSSVRVVGTTHKVLKASAADEEEERELKGYEKGGGKKKSGGLLKLLKMKDFDPDEEEDEEMVKEVLDTTIAVLEEDDDKLSFKDAISILRALRSQIKKRTSMKFATYSNHPEFPDVDLSGAMKMMDGAPPLNQLWGVKKIARVVLRQITSQLALRSVIDKVDNAKTQEEAYKACFTKERILGILPNRRNFLPPPYAVDHWEKDSEFARQFFCGTNPVMIEMAKDPEKQLSKNMVEYFGKDKLQALADKNELLFVSYDDLAELEANPHQMFPLPMNNESGPDGGPAPQVHEKYFYAPIVAFTYDYEKDELDVLGIQLERTDDARVYTKNTCGENEWLVVKCQVIAADSQMHQWVSHLGNTHLTMEPHIIAVYNTLRKAKHPLYTFLKQTSRDTLLLNWAARQTLASNEATSFGDFQSSVGVGQFMQLIGKMWSRYSFFEKSSLPNELASRGFTEDIKIPAYLYREDGMKLWNAIGDFATDFVDEIFDSDEAVASDEVVQEWAKETTDPDKGAVNGFPTSFEDKETVARVLQTIMWVTSGLHAAVNFPQYDSYAYVPNKSLHVRADLSTMPEDDAEIRDWMFENMFPYINTDDEWLREASDGLPSISSLLTVRLLTLPSKNCLNNLSDKFESVGTESYDKFLTNLNVISKEIEARNEEAEKANKAPYNYLNPSNVPASIDI